MFADVLIGRVVDVLKALERQNVDAFDAVVLPLVLDHLPHPTSSLSQRFVLFNYLNSNISVNPIVVSSLKESCT